MLAQTTDRPSLQGHIRYLLEPAEVCTRALSQYVATETKNPTPLAQIAHDAAAFPGMHWSDEDFKKVRTIVRTILKKKGLNL